MNYSTCPSRSAPRLPHLTIAAHITVRTSAESHEEQNSKQHLRLHLRVANYQKKSGAGYDEERIKHWCERHPRLYSLALRQTTFISVAGSTVHASTCKGHWDSCLNGCRSRSQAYTESANNNSITLVT